MQLARKMEPLDISWFEEPVVPEDVQGYRWVVVIIHIIIISSLSLSLSSGGLGTRPSFPSLVENAAS